VSASLKTKAILLFLIAAAAFGGVAAAQGLESYTLKIDFTNADGLVQNEDVTIAGAKVGKVQSLELHDSVAQVTVTVDSQHAPLPSGTKAILRSLGLLGNKYVELVPGTGGGSLSSGSELTIQSTTSPTDLDQLNAIFDKPTRDEMRQMTLQGKIALGGRAQTLNTDLEQLRNLAVAAEPVTGVIDTHQVALDRATIAFDTLTQKLGREDASLRGLVEHGAGLLDAVQQHDAELAGLLSHGDNTFSHLDSILNGNENSLAGVFARQPSALRSSDYSVTAGIPVLRASQPLINPLFDLLYNFQDSVVGETGTGNPNDYSSGTLYGLRALAVVCDQIAPAGSNGPGSC